MLVSIAQIATAMTRGTAVTIAAADRFLDYAASHPDARITYHATDMVYAVVSDASFNGEPAHLTEPRSSGNRVGGYHYLGDRIDDPTRRNHAFHIECTKLTNIVASVAEAELGGLFTNAQTGKRMRTMLAEMGWPQGKTRIECDNSCAVGIANKTSRVRKSAAMDNNYNWVGDQVYLGTYDVHWKPGKTNKADFFTKLFAAGEHCTLRQQYVTYPKR
jgi:hypothetical protein